MNNFVSVIFCRNCGSRYVEISEWTDDGKALIHCRACNCSEETGNFTLGHCQVSNIELQNARDTSARKKKYER